MFLSYLKLLFSGTSRRREAQELYIALVQQSRNPFLYTDCEVPDTIDGRFDLIVLHVFLMLNLPHSANDKVMRRLLLESLFDDMDRSLREMGVGDMGVGKRIQKMSKAAFGRLKAYSESDDTEQSLREALVRNLYRGNAPSPAAMDKLLEYIKKWQQPDVNKPADTAA